jgi:hypothetical protein
LNPSTTVGLFILIWMSAAMVSIAVMQLVRTIRPIKPPDPKSTSSPTTLWPHDPRLWGDSSIIRNQGIASLSFSRTHPQFRDGRNDMAEADRPDFESFRIAGRLRG